MARKISFRTKVAECLDKGDASTFQSLINSKLVESLDIQKIRIISEMLMEQDFESQIVSQLSASALSYGGNDMVYDMGVMDIKFNDADAIKNFTEQLDQIDGIDYYEISEPKADLDNDTGATDLEYQGNKPVYEVTVYLDIENVALPQDIDSYFESLDQVEEACGKKKKKSMNEKCAEEDSEEMDDSEEEDSEEDDSEEVQKESLKFSTIFDKVALHEFLTVKTAHWNQAMHKAVAKTDKVCPPGRTGPDCKTVLTAQQKMLLRKRMAAHLKKLGGRKRSLMATHASATKAFIKQHNLMSKSAAKAKLNPGK